MQYVRQEITSFLTTNLTDTYADWDVATTYTIEADTALTNASIVRYGSYYWRSLVSDNIGFNPEEYENKKWMKWEVSNKYAMLDLSAQSKSTFAGNMTCTFALTKYTDMIGVGYYTADTILIEVLDASDVVLWSYEVPSIIYDGIYDWYTWTYPEYTEEKNRAIMLKIPSALGNKCRVTFNAWSGSLYTDCGFLIAGSAVDMGQTLSDINFKFTSYATKEVDAFGTLKITKRAVQDIVDFETIIDKYTFSNNKRKIKEIYNDIVMFVVDERVDSEFENLITLGVIQDATPILTEFDKIVVSYSIMEAI